MQIRFNIPFALPCVGLETGDVVLIQGYELKIVPSRRYVEVPEGAVFHASLLGNPYGHIAPWVTLRNARVQ
jgi:hypothetical protein